MILKELINKSWYTANGFINSIDSVELLESYILYNMPVLQEFKGIIIATTYKEQDPVLIEANKKLWTKYFPNIILIDIKYNRGHSFGIADSENVLVDYCKENNINWICKSSNDVIIQESILNKEIEEADFYYSNGIGAGGMIKYDFNFDRIMNELFYPQTNFYFIDISKIDYLYNKQYVNETYKHIQTIENYNGKVWEYIPGWSCEDFLKQCIERNKLSKSHLISQEKYRNLLQVIKDFNIHDGSHKNIMIEGICHLQYSEQQILEI
jgi:hypothetical protein